MEKEYRYTEEEFMKFINFVVNDSNQPFLTKLKVIKGYIKKGEKVNFNHILLSGAEGYAHIVEYVSNDEELYERSMHYWKNKNKAAYHMWVDYPDGEQMKMIEYLQTKGLKLF